MQIEVGLKRQPNERYILIVIYLEEMSIYDNISHILLNKEVCFFEDKI